MTRAVLHDIEAARAVLEDGPVGYVLHTRGMRFVCRTIGTANLRLDSPLAYDVEVYTSHTSALVAQRFWNSSIKPDAVDEAVKISLRRPAIVAYIDLQQQTIDTLTGATQ